MPLCYFVIQVLYEWIIFFLFFPNNLLIENLVSPFDLDILMIVSNNIPYQDYYLYPIT